MLILSIVLGLAFSLVERRAKVPVIPTDIWTAPSFGAAMFVVVLSYMSYGIVFWYMAAWQQIIRQWTLLQYAAGVSPLAVFGALAAIFSAWLISVMAAQYVLAIGSVAVIASGIIVATMPEQQNYWIGIFPATVLFSFCPDFIYTAAQIIACNSVQKRHQGVAGSLIGTLQLYGTSLGVGFAGVVDIHTDSTEADPVKGYRNALYLGIGLGAASLLLDIIFVRMPREGKASKKSTQV